MAKDASKGRVAVTAKKAPNPRGEEIAVGSLARGLEIIEVLTSAQTCLTLSEIASQSGLDASTTLRLLHSLVERGYVVRDEANKRYLAGPRALSPVPLFHPLTAFRREAEQAMKSLVENTGHTCALILYVGHERLVVDFLRGRDILSLYYDTWLRTPIHAAAAGKLLLAWLTEPERKTLLGAAPYKALTPDTITEPGVMAKELETVRQQGHAVARGEAWADYVALAVPLLMPVHSRPMGCIVLSSTKELLPKEIEGEAIVRAKAAASLLLNTAPSLHVLKNWTPWAERRQLAASPG